MQKFYQKLELDLIFEQLSELIITEYGHQKLKELTPINDLEAINLLLDQTDEALTIIKRYDRAPLMIQTDLRPSIHFCQKGGILSGLELYQFARLLTTVKANQKHLMILEKENIKAKYYKELIEQMYYDQILEERLYNTVDETGFILDQASSELKSIRNKIRQTDLRIKTKLQEIISANSNKLSQTTVGIRNDRYVIAVKSEYKNVIKGTIHDISASNQTFFIEPMAILQLNLEKNRLFEEEKSECDRILRKLSSILMEITPLLDASYQAIGEIDFIFAKAVLANRQGGNRPQINQNHQMKLVDARHPLLKVAKVIPNNIDFNRYLGIIITGPNTGGKTVLLKTVGLLSLMVKCGLLPPASSLSNIMIYDRICCDIGDDQSIAENLSTFSSHMQNIKHIIDIITPNSLVLFDEIGGGTDPTEGYNLAIAILKYLLTNKISFITTTHYSELKAFAYETSEVVNASMQFDQNTLSPTYKLLLGLPGSSNALSIARRLGLKEEIIVMAEEKLESSNQDVRKMIEKLENQMLSIQEHEASLAKQEAYLNQELAKYQQELRNLENQKAKIIENVRITAEKKWQETNQKALEILEQLKEMKNKEIKLHELIDLKKSLSELVPTTEVNTEEKVVTNQDFRLGDDIYVKKYDQYGSITKVFKGKVYEVAIGNMRIRLNGSELVKQKPVKKETNPTRVKLSVQPAIKLSLDLRGQRYEDALDLLVKYFDDLMLANIKQVSIIHGYGTGVIRTLVQDFLRKNQHVASFRYGQAGEGGMGSTIVTLK